MSGFKLYVAKRFAYMLVTILFISTVIFGATQLLPGNAAEMILGEYATDERVAELESQMELDDPIYVQYVRWLGNLAVGDWGQSYVHNQPVNDMLWDRIAVSAQLVGLSLFVVTVLSIPLGVLTSVKRDSSVDYAITGSTYVGVSMPEFVIGTLLLVLFAGPVFAIFPAGGFESIQDGIIPWLMHLALPVATMTILMLAHLVRQTRSGMINALQAEYTRTARLKGVSEFNVLAKHALRNGLLPTITVLALNVGWLLGGIVVVEEVFSVPGVGRLVIDAIQNRDLPLIQIGVMLIAAAYVVANFCADIAYTYLDPRIDYN